MSVRKFQVVLVLAAMVFSSTPCLADHALGDDAAKEIAEARAEEDAFLKNMSDLSAGFEDRLKAFQGATDGKKPFLEEGLFDREYLLRVGFSKQVHEFTALIVKHARARLPQLLASEYEIYERWETLTDDFDRVAARIEYAEALLRNLRVDVKAKIDPEMKRAYDEIGELLKEADGSRRTDEQSLEIQRKARVLGGKVDAYRMGRLGEGSLGEKSYMAPNFTVVGVRALPESERKPFYSDSALRDKLVVKSLEKLRANIRAAVREAAVK